MIFICLSTLLICALFVLANDDKWSKLAEFSKKDAEITIEVIKLVRNSGKDSEKELQRVLGKAGSALIEFIPIIGPIVSPIADIAVEAFLGKVSYLCRF